MWNEQLERGRTEGEETVDDSNSSWFPCLRNTGRFIIIDWSAVRTDPAKNTYRVIRKKSIFSPIHCHLSLVLSLQDIWKVLNAGSFMNDQQRPSASEGEVTKYWRIRVFPEHPVCDSLYIWRIYLNIPPVTGRQSCIVVGCGSIADRGSVCLYLRSHSRLHYVSYIYTDTMGYVCVNIHRKIRARELELES